MRSYRTPLTILAVCAIVLGPLLSGFFGPDWRARWMLAWAANAYQNGNPNDAAATLTRASELSRTLATDSDFWNLKFDLVFNKEKRTQDDVARLFEESKALISEVPKSMQARTATEVAQRFHLKKLHDQAVELMESTYPPIEGRGAGENNDLAYFRSLTKKNLDIALKEIDAALMADGTSRREFLDTKAWVLHGLKRDEEALLFADEAIAKVAAELNKKLPPEDVRPFMALLFPERETSSDADVKTDEFLRSTNRLEVLKDLFPHINPIVIEAWVRQLASLRFHRACILDELGRSDESDLDYAWLDQFGFTNTAEIF